MKKRLFVAAALLLGMAVSVLARPVDEAKALRVATAYMQAMNAKGASSLALVPTEFSEFYVFASGEGGFVIVSGDDCVVPILGWSATSVFDGGELPSNVRQWLGGYEAEIGYWRRREAAMGGLRARDAENATAAQWERLLAGERPVEPLATSVSPLLSTTWNQSPYYNAYCPYDSDYSERAVTGCVATATAQIMKYWNHPSTGYGSHTYVDATYGTQSANFGTTTYQWSQMPASLTGASSQAQIDAVATLMYHIGVADEMSYGVSAVGGSGAFNYNYYGTLNASSQTSLMKYFKYRPDIAAIARGDYDDTQYCALIRAELDQQRPVLYSGSNTSGGHSFVCDGYNEQGQFHFNWGWGSARDGYYAMGSLNPGTGGIGGNSSGTYNMNNVILTGIRPSTAWGESAVTTITTSVSGGTGCSVSGGGTYSFGDTVQLLATTPEGYRFDHWSDGSKMNPRELVATGGSYSFTAHFTALDGDTLGYCASGHDMNSYGSGGSSTVWGVKLPASVVQGKVLQSVLVYAPAAATYGLTVYGGASSATDTLATGTVSAAGEGWQQITFASPVPVPDGQSVWLGFHCSDYSYPAAFTTYGGNANSLLWGSSLQEMGYSRSFMIKGIFATPTMQTGDTLSYCNNDTVATTVGNRGRLEWGVMMPASVMGTQGINPTYVKSVMLYVAVAGDYALNIYAGGDTVPGTLVHRQVVSFSGNQTGWQEVLLDAHYLPTAENHWFTFSTTDIDYPAAGCAHTGFANSDWLSTDGVVWSHSTDYNLDYSWMIKVVLTHTLPTLPVPTVRIVGQQQVALGLPAVFEADGTANSTVSWQLAGGVPSSATGYTAATTWQTAGWHRVVATIGNAGGTSAATLDVLVVDYALGDTLSYCLDREQMTAVGMGSNSPMTWGVMFPPALLGANRYQIDKVLVGAAEPGSYSITIYSGGDAEPQTQVHSGTFSLTSADTANTYFDYVPATPIVLDRTANLWVVLHTDGLQYPARTCAGTVDSNADWTNIGSGWRHLYEYNLIGSWMIKIVTSEQPQSTMYTLTVLSNDTTMGTVSGGGQYEAGTQVAISATANDGYRFVQWNDSDTHAVRQVTVSSDTAFRATFEAIPVLPTYTLTVVSNDTTMGTVSGGGQYEAGTQVAISATANDGYRFVQWNDSDTHAVRQVTVSSDTAFRATFEAIPVLPTYTLTVVSNDTTMGTVSGGGQYTAGSIVNISATANDGYRFVQWDDGNASPSRFIAVLADITYTATFEPLQQPTPRYTIVVVSSDNTMGSVSGSGTYDEGDTVTISATANDGYRFVRWNDGDTNRVREVVVTADVTYLAIFEALPGVPQYRLTVLSNNNTLGAASGSGNYPEGGQATIAAMALDGAYFVRWHDGDTNPVRSVTVEANAIYIALFAAGTAPERYTVSVDIAGDSVNAEVSGSGRYLEGTEATVTATAHHGYTFAYWIVNGDTTSRIADNPYTFTVESDMLLTAHFEPWRNSIGGVQLVEAAIAPNPASEKAVVSGVETGAAIALIDASGRLCGSWTAQGETLCIDVAGLQAGVYFVKIRQQDGAKTLKLIVRH